MRKPLNVQLVISEKERLTGVVLQMNLTGIMVELDKIPFKVSSYLDAIIQLSDQSAVTLRVRSVKNYNKFYRNPPPKKPKPGEKLPEPKMLAELHFHLLDGKNKVAITKALIQQKTGNV